MKKLFILISLLFIAMCIEAQVAVVKASGSTIAFLPNQRSVAVTTTAGDTVGGINVKYWIFNVSKAKLQFWSYVVNIDTIRRKTRVAGNRVAVKNYGSINGTTWVPIGSTIFYNKNAGTNNDSTFAFSDVATGVLWNYLKLEFTGVVANKASKPTVIQLKVSDKN